MTNSNLNNPKKKEDPALKFMGKLDKGIFDAQAKTVDFFDNTFLGNKRSLDEIKANRQKIIDEANAKKEELFKEYSDKTAVDDVIRAGLSVPFHLVNETNNQVRGLFSAVQGNPYEENNIFDLEALRLKTKGDDESLAYSLTQTIGQFGIPFGGFSKGLKTVGLSSKGFKAAGLSSKAAKLAKPTRFFVAGQLTDAFNFSPYEENLFDLANQWGAIRNPVFEYLGAADEEIPFLEAKFRQQLSGGIAGEIVGGGIKGIAKGGGKLADVGADLFSKQTGDSLTNFFTSLNSIRQNPLKKQKALETFSEFQKTTLSEADTLSKTDLDLIADETDDVFDEILNYKKQEPAKPKGKLPKDLIPTETNQSIPSRKTLPPVQEEAELIYNAIDEARTKDPNFLKVMTDEMQIQRAFRLMKQPDYVIEKLEDIWRRYGDQTKYTQRDFVLAGSMLQGRNAKNIDRLAAVLEEARLTNNEELYNRTSEVFVNKWTEFLRLAFPVKNVTGEAAGTTRVRQLSNEQLKTPSIDESIKNPSKTKNVSSSRLNVLGQIENLKKQQQDEKLIQDLFPSKEELVEKLRNKDTSDLLDFTRKLRTAAGDAKKLQDLLVEKGPEGKLRKSVATGLEISKEIYVNQLLGAPETQKVNIYTGLINTLLGPADYLSVAAFDGNPTGVARGVGEIISQLVVFGDSMRMAAKAFKMNRNILAPANVKLVSKEGSAIKRVGESIRTDPPKLLKDLNIPIIKNEIKLPFNKSIGPIAINNESVSDVVKTVGTIINLPGRFTQSFGDEAIKQQIFRSGALPMIIEKGYNSGLRGKQLHKFTNKVFEEVNTMMAKQSIEGASDLAMEVYETQALQSIERTFTRPLGTGYGKSLTKPLSKVLKHPALSFVNAFVGTPINISKAAIRRFGTLPTAPFTRYDESAPGGALNKLFSGTVNRKGKPINIGFGNLLKEYNDAMLSDDYATRAKAIGEARVGQAMLLTFALMSKAKDDPEAEIVLVGAGPRNYSAQKIREENGEIPNSFGFLAKDELGEVIYGPDGRPERYYIQFGRLDPFAGPLQVMGDWPDVVAALDVEDQEEAGSVLVALARRQIQDAPFLGGLSEFLGMTDNADNFARYWARQVLLRTMPGFASVEDIAKGLGMPESTVKYLGIGTLGLSKIPVPMPQTLARSIKRSQQYDYYDGMTGITYKIQNPRFDKKIKKGDLTKQEIREDGTLKNQDKIPLVTDFFTRFGINYLRELSMGVNGWDADLEPVRNRFTGKFQEYPVGLGYKNFNPIKTSKSENNPITTFMQDIGYRPVKLQSEIYGGIYLNQADWTQINNSIPLLKDEDGVRVQEKYLNFINDPEVQQRLKIITEGVEAIDSQRSKTLRDKYIKELRTGWHKIYKESEQRAIDNWITKPEQVQSGKLDAYIKDREALNEEYNTNLDR